MLLADTREQIAELNDAIRDRLVTIGRVDDQQATTTSSGQRIGAGDEVGDAAQPRKCAWRQPRNVDGGSRRNRRSGSPSPGKHGQRILPTDYARDHVELAYATDRPRCPRRGDHYARRAG